VLLKHLHLDLFTLKYFFTQGLSSIFSFKYQASYLIDESPKSEDKFFVEKLVRALI
jgi:hypothetical protein